MAAIDKILKLGRQLYPKGRAFKMPYGGIFARLKSALSLSVARAYEAARSTLDSALPDNDNFTPADALDWERRLGMVQYPDNNVALADRKAAILRKMRHPGTIKARQNFRYIETQLRLANFNVHVYENKYFVTPPGEYQALSPLEVTGEVSQLAQLGSCELGDTQLGTTSGAITVVANYIEEAKDNGFNVGANYRSTFFIAGITVDTPATVLAARKDEFRQLILLLKPVQSVAYLYVEYA